MATTHTDDGPHRPDHVFTDDEVEFLSAVEAYKKDNRRPFPSWCEILRVLRSLGYRKVQPADPPIVLGGRAVRRKD
jgi:hypothetical protein